PAGSPRSCAGSSRGPRGGRRRLTSSASHASIRAGLERRTTVQSFEQIRSLLGARHALRTNDPYLISFDLTLEHGRHQGIYLAEMDDEDGRKILRISTPVGPFTGMDATRCLRFNWEQRTGYLSISDLEGSPYL